MKIKNEWVSQAKIDHEKYLSMYKDSIENNDNFWKNHADRISWYKKFTKVKDIKYSNTDVSIKWFEDGLLNVSYNCIDRHAEKNPDKVAIIWEGDDPSDTKKITYSELLKNVSKTANVLKQIGIKNGDRVTIYLTMIPELA